MMALENKETMQNCEATLKCLQTKGFPWGCGRTSWLLNGQFMELPNEFYHKPTLQHESGSWSTFYPDSHKLQPYPPNAFGSQFYQFPADNRFHYPPYNMVTQGYPYEFQFQDFQYFVVIDFEATCDKERNPHPQEIIEFPSVIVSSVTGQLEACFQTYVRPTCNQLLSDFCKDLTGIQQIQVDRGVTLSEALLRHDKWLEKKGIKNTNFAVVTWSNWDCRVMLESECQFKKIRKPPYFNRWINLKVPFHEVLVVQARLLALLMRQGFKFAITNSLMWQASDGPVTWNPIPENTGFSPHHPHKPKDQQMPLFQYHPYCFCGVKSSKEWFGSLGQSKEASSSAAGTGLLPEVLAATTSSGLLPNSKICQRACPTCLMAS
ncbi:hypothetical protein GQ457_09G026210 [Hibiscus cannabinus]